MDLERITDVERERAAQVLQAATGDGRLTLEEFSERVGKVWAADTAAELEHATADVRPAPAVGTRTRARVVNVFGDERVSGRWCVPAHMHVFTVFGDCVLDLRNAVVARAVVEAGVLHIGAQSVFGDIKVIVPEGVDVELGGFAVFGDRRIHLSPVPRRSGTPLVRVRVHSLFGDALVCSDTSGSHELLPKWAQRLLRRA